MKKLYFAIVLMLLVNLKAQSKEGMWLPVLLEQLNYNDMKSNGLRLTAEDIYSVNKSSLKDAIVLFGRGCTGEIVSEEGLLITNHHCGFGQIQSHSTVQHDYLKDGFWAMSKEEELPNEGLSVSFLVRMEDVTEKVLNGVTANMIELNRANIIADNCKKIEEEAIKGTQYKALIKPFYYGNEYYMFVYEVFKDVRLVGAPPSSIGKFGGDTDNWMWPRHTGDFSLFRIYANKNNEAAEYSKDNVPYKPKKVLKVSLKGVKKDDFTFVYGFPGTTTQYLASGAVDMISNFENPTNIKYREKRLEIMSFEMKKSDFVRIQYASKYAGIANSWKKWIGENRGLKRLNAIEKKKVLEAEFDKWANADEKRKAEYGNIITTFNGIYKNLIAYDVAYESFYEAIWGVEILKYAYSFEKLIKKLEKAVEGDFPALKKQYKVSVDAFFKNYNVAIDKKIMASLLKMYYQSIDKSFYGENYNLIQSKYKGDYELYAEYVFSKSMFTDKEKLYTFIEKLSPKSAKQIKNDPAYKAALQYVNINSEKVTPYYDTYFEKLDSLYRIYVKGLREMNKEKIFYPDANSTLRIAYGKVDDYSPKDGVEYGYYTTLDGILEKESDEVEDYVVPAKLKELYKKKDFGRYAVNGTVPVAFSASNHTTGGNSGSPVLDADGNLIGINFDRNWEGTMSDIMYDPSQCRNIALDVRYLCFIIEKYAGANHLIKEMQFVE